MNRNTLRKGTVTDSAFKNWLVLSKPGIVGLVVVSTLAGFYIGASIYDDVVFNFTLMWWTVAGTILSTIGSAMLNNFIDRDIDAIMDRTSHRALAAKKLNPTTALFFGFIISLTAVAVHLKFVNGITAFFNFAAIIGYVVIYTMILKRHSPWANQIGGIAGALPPVIGYLGATGRFDIYALSLFLIVVVWQQPHALSLALKYRHDYAKANIPVVPVAKGVEATKLRILLYTGLLVPISFIPYFIGMTGSLYLATAVLLGIPYLIFGARFLLSKKQEDMFLFFYSIIYLSAIFIVMVIDIA